MPSRRIIVHVPTFVLGLCIVLGGNVWATESAHVEPSLTAEEEEALAFRETFGLDSSLHLIRAAARDQHYSAEDYGVPLSPAEQSEMQRRAQVQLDIRPAIDLASEQPSFAGLCLSGCLSATQDVVWSRGRSNTLPANPARFPAGVSR